MAQHHIALRQLRCKNCGGQLVNLLNSSGNRTPAVIFALALVGSLIVPLESKQRANGRSPAEPAPIAAGRAPRGGEYSAAFDAIHYDIHVALPVSGSVIEGTTDIEIGVGEQAPATLPLDFTGLAVLNVTVNGAASSFTHDAGKLRIALPLSPLPSGTRIRVAVAYRGTPDDGLFVRNNVHGHRAAFADNWPNRARFWFPALDHPADKATASITVVAPEGWDVVANGLRDGAPVAVAATDGTPRRQFRWTIDEPISPYNMVVGAAEFRVTTVGRPCFSNGRCVEVTTWLYPESADVAAASFRRASAIVEYFSQLIAPFPYGKLAHVQSSTRFGGMENASAIFYDERLLAAGRNNDGLVAHETAHQWFGDAVTEADWRDVWLSEGFATYFSALFLEHADGPEAFRRVMEDARQRVVNSDRKDRPIVDGQEQDLFKLLNANSYEKGGWVLHMLRGLVGDEPFFDGIRRYYREHEHRTASTIDLQRAMEAASGRTLDTFFDQWLFRPGFPRLRVSSRWNAAERMADVVIEQVQPSNWPTFTAPLTIELHTPAGPVRRRVELDERTERYRVPLDVPPSGVTVDPEGWLLKEMAGR
jgi:aminopeptidase N